VPLLTVLSRCLPRVVLIEAAVIAVVGLPGAAAAPPVPSEPPQAAAVTLPDVEVVGTTPVLGSGIDRDKVPGESSVLTGRDIARDGNAALLRSLEETTPGVTLDDAAGNRYQPNLYYHGFQASPLQGNAQGLAVYLNGIRFNQPFGDTVNWDLLPDNAIDEVNLVGANPAYGLNALGGALSVQTKTGFTFRGAELNLLGGSFGRVEGQFQYGVERDGTAAYIAGTAAHDGGWRDEQTSDVYNIFGDIGWRGERGELHLSIVGADNTLNGPGTSPVQLIEADPRQAFTQPNRIANTYGLIALNGSVSVGPTTSLQALAYYDSFQQRVINGNATEFGSCGDGQGFLCNGAGDLATDRGGNPVPDFLPGGPYSQLDRQSTDTSGYGASLQMTDRRPVLGLSNQLTVGGSYDGASTLFSGASDIGGLTFDSRDFVGPGIPLDQPDGSIVPVRVGITSNTFGFFLTDTLDLTPRLSLTAGGRFNNIQTNLRDQNGGALSGEHVYSRFNPSIGLAWRLTDWLTPYAGYSESNRAPTPAELSCADPALPCSLANFFVGDPNLKQVVGHSVEAGLRGRFRLFAEGTLSWNAGYFHTDLHDDILFVNSDVLGRAFFQNVGQTRRQGVDAGLSLRTERWIVYANYSYIDATFDTGFTAASPNNPGADADGNIFVTPGDRLPGIPRHLVKFGASWRVTEAWTVGAAVIAASGQVLFGDEANLTPRTPGYFVLNLNTSYRLTPQIELFGLVRNVTDARYYTYGTFSPTGAIPIVQAPGASNPRSYSVAAPVGGFAGVRLTF